MEKKEQKKELTEKYEVINGYIIVEAIDVTPKDKKGNQILGIDGKPTASLDKLKQHPYQAKVIEVSETYHDGGVEYKSPIKKGDILLLRDMSYLAKEKNPPIMIIYEKQYIYIRHSDVIAIVK